MSINQHLRARPSRTVAFGLLALGLLAPAALRAQDPAADRLYREAQRLEQAGDPGAALEELQLLVQQFPGDRQAPRALLDMVRLRRAAGDLAAARNAVQKLLADYPRTDASAAAFVHQAEIELDEARSTADLEEARKTFRRVPLLYGRESYPGLAERSKARVRSGEISLLLGDPRTAISDGLAVVEDEAPSVWTGRAKLRLGQALMEVGDWTAAAEILQRLAEEDDSATTSSVGDRAQARDLLSFLHRHFVRPAAGQERWRTSARYPAGTPVREPSAVAASRDGQALLVDRRADWVARLAADGQVVETRSIADAVRPGWSDGSALLVTNTAIELPFEGQRTRFLEPQPGKEVELKGMVAAERGIFGHWFIAARGTKGLLVFESPRRGQALLTADRPELVDLARDPRGRVYTLDRRTETVGRLDVDRLYEGTVASSDAWRRPVAVDVDRLGQIYVLDRGNRTVDVFDGQGRPLAKLGPILPGGIELRAPVDLAVDGTGRLLIADEKIPFLVVLE